MAANLQDGNHNDEATLDLQEKLESLCKQLDVQLTPSRYGQFWDLTGCPPPDKETKM